MGDLYVHLHIWVYWMAQQLILMREEQGKKLLIPFTSRNNMAGIVPMVISTTTKLVGSERKILMSIQSHTRVCPILFDFHSYMNSRVSISMTKS